MEKNNKITFNQICNTAILRSGALTNKSSFELLENLATTLIEHKQYDSFSKDSFNDDFYDFYHLHLNSIVLGEVLTRLTSKRYLKKLDKNHFETKKEEIRKINALLSFESFSNECSLFVTKLNEYLTANNLELSREETEVLLTKHIEENLTVLGNPMHTNELPNPVEQFLMDSFVKQIKSENGEYYRIYQNILIGRLLAAFIVNNSDCGNDKTVLLDKMNLFLDTGVVFKLLGLDNYSTADEYVDMIDTLRSLGAKVKIFKHLYDEVFDIIDGSKYWINNYDYSPGNASRVAEYFISNKYSIEEVDEYLFKLEDKLLSYGIQIEDVDIDYNEPDQFGLYEEDIFEKIKEQYEATGFFSEEKIETYRLDAKSIFYIHKLRKGKKYKKINEVRYVLLTTNRGLAKIACDCVSNGGKNIAYAITDAYLSLLLFFTYPGYSDETNMKFLIPAAYHAFKPSRELLIKMEHVLKEMRQKGVLTESEVFSWISNITLGEEVVIITNNNPNNFDEATPEAVMKKIKDDANELIIKKGLEAEARILKAKKESDEAFEKYADSEKKRKLLIEELNKKDEEKLISLREQKRLLDLKISRKTKRRKTLIFIVFMLILLIVFASLAVLVDFLFNLKSMRFVSYVVSSILALVTGSVSFNQMIKWSGILATKITLNKGNVITLKNKNEEIETLEKQIKNREKM